MRPSPTACVGLRRTVTDGCHCAWQIWGGLLKDRAVRVVILLISECGPEGRRDWDTSLGDPTDRSPKIGGSGRGCGRVVAPGSPGRSRNVASQPAPKRPHCGRTPNSPSTGRLRAPPSFAGFAAPPLAPAPRSVSCWRRRPPGSRLPGQPDRRAPRRSATREQDEDEQRYEDQAGAGPHAFGSLRLRPIGTPGSVAVALTSVATVTTLAVRRPSSAAAERRSRAIVHMP